MDDFTTIFLTLIVLILIGAAIMLGIYYLGEALTLLFGA